MAESALTGASIGLTGQGYNNIQEFKSLLESTTILPGAQPSYEMCKAIASAHPNGRRIVTASVNLAVAKGCHFNFPDDVENTLEKHLKDVLEEVGGFGPVKSLLEDKRIYGQAVMIIGAWHNTLDEKTGKTKKEYAKSTENLSLDQIENWNLFFNIVDPQILGGRQNIGQNPTKEDYQKFGNIVEVESQTYIRSRFIGVLNTVPQWIWWSNSAYSFGGLSAYASCLYQLRTLLELEITLWFITKKMGLLVYKQKQDEDVPTEMSIQAQAHKARKAKRGETGNVLGISIEEDIQSINLTTLHQALAEAKKQALQGIAVATGEPATILGSESFANGWTSGNTDAELVKNFLKNVQTNEVEPVLRFMLSFVMKRAFTPEYLEQYNKEFQKKIRNADDLLDSLTIEWPDPLSTEKDEINLSKEKDKQEIDQLNAFISAYSVISNGVQTLPDTVASMTKVLIDNINELKIFRHKFTFTDKDLSLLSDELEKAQKQQQEMIAQGKEGKDNTEERINVRV